MDGGNILIGSNLDHSSTGVGCYIVDTTWLWLDHHCSSVHGSSDELQLSNQFTIRRKQKHNRDSARQIRKTEA